MSKTLSIPFVIFSLITNEVKPNIVSIDSCEDNDTGAYAGITILEDDGRTQSYWCQFGVEDTCNMLEESKSVEITASALGHKFCEIKDEK